MSDDPARAAGPSWDDTASPDGARPPDAPQSTDAATPDDGSAARAVGGPSGERPDGAVLGGRLHPSAIGVWSLRSVAPLVAVWLASEAVGRSLGLVALGLVLGGAWIRWLRFEWRIESEQVVIEQGLLQRTRRVIPIARIQAVQTVRKLQHRIFGVVGLRIEAIGGSETEGQLDALDPDVARRVQHTLMQRAGQQASTSAPGIVAAPAQIPGTGTTTAQPLDAHRASPPGVSADTGSTDDVPGRVVARCTPRMLVIAGLTGGRVGVAAAIIGLAQQLFGEQLTEAALSAPERLGLATALVLTIVAVIAAFLLSVAATALTYWDFTVRRDGSLLRLHRGLLDERRDTVPLARVQSVTVEENVLRRVFGLAAVKMVVAGRAGSDSDVTGTLLPIADRAAALRLLRELFDGAGIDDETLTPMPIAARRRRVTRAVVASLAVIAATWLAAGGYAVAVGLAVAAVAFPAATGSYRALGWAFDGDVILARSGWLVRRLTVTPVRALQSVRLSSSPFQRRVDLATLHLEIARTRGGRDPRLLDLRAADASALLATLAAAQPRDTAGAGAS